MIFMGEMLVSGRVGSETEGLGCFKRNFPEKVPLLSVSSPLCHQSYQPVVVEKYSFVAQL